MNKKRMILKKTSCGHKVIQVEGTSIYKVNDIISAHELKELRKYTTVLFKVKKPYVYCVVCTKDDNTVVYRKEHDQVLCPECFDRKNNERKPYDVDKEKNLTPNRMLKIKENIQQRIFNAMQSNNQEDAKQARHELRTLPW